MTTGSTAPELAVGAILVVDGRLLLVERGRPPAKGRWSVPGGRVERGETLSEAVVREVHEETGLAVRCGELLGWVERLGEDHHFVILDFEAELAEQSDDLPSPEAGDDAAAARWVSIGDLASWPLVDGLLEFLVEHVDSVASRPDSPSSAQLR